jgi:hypothetical protein
VKSRISGRFSVVGSLCIRAESWAVSGPQFVLGLHAMELEAGIDGEAPAQLLLLRTEVPCRIGHRDDLRLIHSVRLSVGHDSRPPAGENVLHPIGTFGVRKGDQQEFVVLDRYDRCFVGPTR